jgi:hypothetical protein
MIEVRISRKEAVECDGNMEAFAQTVRLRLITAGIPVVVTLDPRDSTLERGFLEQFEDKQSGEWVYRWNE